MRTLLLAIALVTAACGGSKKSTNTPASTDDKDEAVDTDADDRDSARPDDADDMPSRDMADPDTGDSGE